MRECKHRNRALCNTLRACPWGMCGNACRPHVSRTPDASRLRVPGACVVGRCFHIGTKQHATVHSADMRGAP
eukprot:12053585-Alexandrium_andersonii.AAC.1